MRRRDFVGGVAAGASPVLAGAIAVDRKRHPIGSRTSCSQQGEDIVLYHVARDLLGTPHPTCLDIGAADPIEGNNTYLMCETLGGHGVLVEPNPTFTRALRSARPRDIVVEAGIGVAETKGDPLDLKRFRPGCICAETAPMWTPEQNSDITRYLLSVGYVVRGGSTVNTYVDDRRLPHGQG